MAEEGARSSIRRGRQRGQGLSGLQHAMAPQHGEQQCQGRASPPETLCLRLCPTGPRRQLRVCRGSCHSSVPLFSRSYSSEFLSSVCFVSALNEQEEKGRSLDKSHQGADTLRLPPAGMPSPALMRGRGETGGH